MTKFPTASLLLLTVLGLTSASCTTFTKRLYSDQEYVETVSAVLISEDGKQLAFIGRDYHYIFATQEAVLKTLQAPFHKYVVAKLYPFVVEGDGSVHGRVILFLQASAKDADRTAAEAAGYKQGEKRLEADVELHGIRYSAGANPAIGAGTPLNKSYEVQVTVKPTTGDKTMRVLLTPIAVTADGVLTIAAVPLIAVGFGALVTVCGTLEAAGNGCR